MNSEKLHVNRPYEQLLQEESLLTNQVQTYENVLDHMFAYIEQNGLHLHYFTLEDMLTCIHSLSCEIQTELLFLRLEKAMMACKGGRRTNL